MVTTKHAQSLTLLLLAAARNRTDLELEYFSETQIQWAVASGLGRCSDDVSRTQRVLGRLPSRPFWTDRTWRPE